MIKLFFKKKLPTILCNFIFASFLQALSKLNFWCVYNVNKIISLFLINPINKYNNSSQKNCIKMLMNRFDNKRAILHYSAHKLGGQGSVIYMQVLSSKNVVNIGNHYLHKHNPLPWNVYLKPPKLSYTPTPFEWKYNPTGWWLRRGASQKPWLLPNNKTPNSLLFTWVSRSPQMVPWEEGMLQGFPSSKPLWRVISK